VLIGWIIQCLTATILDPALAKRDQSHTSQVGLIGMKFADEAIKSRATRRSNSTSNSSESAGCPAGKVELRMVMIGVCLPEEGGPVSTVFSSAFFGNLLTGFFPRGACRAELDQFVVL
jgi:hypothetical protein